MILVAVPANHDLCVCVCVCVCWGGGGFGRRVTCMRNKGSSVCAAVNKSCPYSKYSAILCRKLSGSLNITGIVILDNS